MTQNCPQCGSQTTLPRLCKTCKRIQTVDNMSQTAYDGPHQNPTYNRNTKSNIIRHIAAAGRILRQKTKRNHTTHEKTLDRLIRQVRHERITQDTLHEELRAIYEDKTITHVEARFELRQAAQHAHAYNPDTPSHCQTEEVIE